MMPSAAREASRTSVAGSCWVASEGFATNPAADATAGARTAARRIKGRAGRGIPTASHRQVSALPGAAGRSAAGEPPKAYRSFFLSYRTEVALHVKIVVTIKLVPNPNAEKRIDPQTKRLVRTGVETVLNPYDEYALEAALQLKERAGGDTTVTIFSMAPDSLKEGLRRALAMGADDAVVLSDAGLEGSDVWATAYAMSAALRTLSFDLLVVAALRTTAVPVRFRALLPNTWVCRALR